MPLEEKTVDQLPRLKEWQEKGKTVHLTKSNVEVFYVASEDFGNTTKPRLVLIHGYPTSSHDFRRVWPTLEAYFSLLTWDFVGYGFSQKVHRTILEQVDVLDDIFTQEFGVYMDRFPVHVLSHDLGDSVMQEMAYRAVHEEHAPYIIQSITALNGGMLPGMHRPTFIQQLLLKPCIGSIIASFMSINLLKKSISKVFGPNTKPTDLDIQEFYASIEHGNGKALITKNITYMTERITHRDRFVSGLTEWSNANNGFLLIDGPYDPVSGKHLAEAVAQHIPKSIVVLLGDDIGHWPQLEAPEALLDEFFKYHVEVRKTFSNLPAKPYVIPE